MYLRQRALLALPMARSRAKCSRSNLRANRTLYPVQTDQSGMEKRINSFSKKMIKYLTVAVLLILISYGLREAWPLLAGPALSIDSPTDNESFPDRSEEHTSELQS